MKNVDLKREQTMSSREIAELMGKRHDNALRDIRNMVEELNSDLSYQQNQGLTEETCPQTHLVSCYHLDRYRTEVLTAGYGVKRRAAIIKRWYELEAKSQELPEWRQPSELLPASHKEDQDYANYRIIEDLKLAQEVCTFCKPSSPKLCFTVPMS